jgi:hypothetical protein
MDKYMVVILYLDNLACCHATHSSSSDKISVILLQFLLTRLKWQLAGIVFPVIPWQMFQSCTNIIKFFINQCVVSSLYFLMKYQIRT